MDENLWSSNFEKDSGLVKREDHTETQNQKTYKTRQEFSQGGSCYSEGHAQWSKGVFWQQESQEFSVASLHTSNLSLVTFHHMLAEWYAWFSICLTLPRSYPLTFGFRVAQLLPEIFAAKPTPRTTRKASPAKQVIKIYCFSNMGMHRG